MSLLRGEGLIYVQIGKLRKAYAKKCGTVANPNHPKMQLVYIQKWYNNFQVPDFAQFIDMY
jgi:hypothetical protein